MKTPLALILLLGLVLALPPGRASGATADAAPRPAAEESATTIRLRQVVEQQRRELEILRRDRTADLKENERLRAEVRRLTEILQRIRDDAGGGGVHPTVVR